MAMRRAAETKTLPQDIILDIVYRLPTKSIGKFRCVSKYWRTLLSDPHFIKAHLAVQSRKAEETFIHSHELSLYTLTFNGDDDFISTKLDFQLQDMELLYIAGSCNGLILGDYAGMINYLINPITLEYQVIPKSPLAQLGGDPEIMYGLGYDVVSDDYKVVSIACYEASVDDDEFMVYDVYVDVYSVGKGLWRRLENVIYDWVPECSHGILVNGALHWLANPFDSLIVAFDVSAETFSEVPPPDHTCGHMFFLATLRGCLSLCTGSSRYTDYTVLFWMMKDYGVKESWTMFKFNEPSFSDCICVPLHSMNDDDDDIILTVDGLMVGYDVKEKDWGYLKDSEVRVPNAHIFVDSLVSLPFGNGIEG